MSQKRPLRVLHIIDTLGGGGSERLIWDIVRLSDPAKVTHRVVTIFPDGFFGPFVYAAPLRQLGAYGSKQSATSPSSEHNSTNLPSAESRVSVDQETRSQSGGRVVNNLRKLPPSLKTPIASNYSAAFSQWQQLKRVAASYFPSSFNILWEFFRFRPDVVHTHGFYSFKYGLLFKKLFRRPTMHMVPSLVSQMHAQGTGWLADHYQRFHPLVDCFALDPGYRGELLGLGVPAEKLFDITGVLDLQTIGRVKAERERHRREVRDELGISEHDQIALSVGRLDPTKGHRYALEALPLMLKRFPNLHWMLLGEGAGRSELEARIRELGLARHAHLRGFVANPLPSYAAADVYLRTTTMEGENISSRQAMAMGLPVVGFDSCRETDLIPQLGHGKVVATGDVAALAAAVCEILALPAGGQELGARSVSYCNERMSLQKQVDDFSVAYLSLHSKKIPVQELAGVD